jgi:hypothetical protein
MLTSYKNIVCVLTQRVRAGRATFLIKVKSNRGERINECADSLAKQGREICDDNKRWDVRTDRMTFEVQKGKPTRANSRPIHPPCLPIRPPLALSLRPPIHPSLTHPSPAHRPGKAGEAPTASLKGMRLSEKAEVLEKA